MADHSWDAGVERLEQEGEELLVVVTSAAAWVATEATGPIRRILDVGSGPGVGTCELARRFPSAEVIAVDGSAAMLERAAARAAALGFGARVTTRRAELPGGLGGLEPIDLAFASMSLHHVPDPAAALASIRRVLALDGLLVVVEHGPGVEDDQWHRPVIDVPALLADAGFRTVGVRDIAGRSIVLARV